MNCNVFILLFIVVFFFVFIIMCCQGTNWKRLSVLLFCSTICCQNTLTTRPDVNKTFFVIAFFFTFLPSLLFSFTSFTPTFFSLYVVRLSFLYLGFIIENKHVLNIMFFNRSHFIALNVENGDFRNGDLVFFCALIYFFFMNKANKACIHLRKALL